MNCIAVTGGLGYIGSHIIAELALRDQAILIIDDLSNSHDDKFAKLKIFNDKNLFFEKCDIRNKSDLKKILRKYSPDGLIHLAASKYVAESVSNPMLYYDNNVSGLISLLEGMSECQVSRFVFSSTAALYGSLGAANLQNGFIETDDICLSSPYAKSKRVCEEILEEFSRVNDQMDICVLRYFNPAGAHGSLLIGEDITEMSTNVFPQICKAAHQKKPFFIHGTNYPTPDGSAERDFIHIEDLAEFHVSALDDCPTGFSLFNVGTGVSTSILNLLDTFERVNNVRIKRIDAPMREGDVAWSFANVSKARSKFGFLPKRTLDDICLSAWKYFLTQER